MGGVRCLCLSDAARADPPQADTGHCGPRQSGGAIRLQPAVPAVNVRLSLCPEPFKLWIEVARSWKLQSQWRASFLCRAQRNFPDRELRQRQSLLFGFPKSVYASSTHSRRQVNSSAALIKLSVTRIENDISSSRAIA